MKRGRPRKDANRHLPDYVYLTKRGYVWKEYSGAKFVRELLLCGSDAAISEVWEQWETLTKGPKNTLSWLSKLYLESDQHKMKADRTRLDYGKYHESIMQTAVSTGVFGSVPLKKITPGVIRKYLDKRAKTAPVLANREVAYLSIVFAWGYERDLCGVNPCKGVRKITEKARGRYVTDDEFQSRYNQANANIRAAMEIAYLCRLRKVEVLDLTRRSMLDEGLEVVRRKGSRGGIIKWSPRLRAAVNLALATNTKHKVQSEYLIRNAKGQQMTTSGFDSMWRRLMDKEGPAFTFHDLKAKGISDFEGDKKKGGGHRTDAMVDRYDRKTDETEATR